MHIDQDVVRSTFRIRHVLPHQGASRLIFLDYDRLHGCEFRCGVEEGWIGALGFI